jgi:FkbM family methyltransferase
MSILHELGGRHRLLGSPITRNLARAALRMNIGSLGDVSESFKGVFRIKAFGISAYYELGANDTIGEVLYWYGLQRFEPETVPLFIQFAKSSRGILDIGSNTGLFSILACAANPDVKVLAWEPVPYLNEKLRRNIELNGFVERCESREAAVGNCDGEAEFYISSDSTMSSFQGSMATYDGHTAVATRVRQERLDSTVCQDFPVDLIKIDVEGHEFEALSGAMSALKRWHPRIIFECLPRIAPGPIESLLRDMGYHIYELSIQGPVEVARISASQGPGNNCMALFPPDAQKH